MSGIAIVIVRMASILVMAGAFGRVPYGKLFLAMVMIIVIITMLVLAIMRMRRSVFMGVFRIGFVVGFAGFGATE